MSMMDSSFLATPSVQSANPLDMLMNSLRAQIVGEVKSDITGDIIDRVIRIVGSAIGNVNITMPAPDITVPTAVSVDIPSDIVSLDVDMTELATQLQLLRQCIESCMSMTVERTVHRTSEGLIDSIIERRY